MSDQEFNVYLSLLGRFLNLKPGQREEVADELRDHLEQRLDELTRDGMSRAKAIRLALDEFGDAASLAAHFSHLASRRKRRFLMRCTFGSIGLTAAAILITIAVWPAGDANNIPPRAVAQDADLGSGSAEGKFRQPSSAGSPAGLPGGIGQSSPAGTPATPGGVRPVVSADRKAPSNEQIGRAAVEAKLNMPIEKVEFSETPLQEALDFISEAATVDILVNETSLAEEGLELTEPVSLVLKHSKVSAATALKLVLERASDGALVYRIRDGLVYVDTEINSEDELEVQVYNCRDLIGEFSEVILQPARRRNSGGFGGGAEADEDEGFGEEMEEGYAMGAGGMVVGMYGGQQLSSTVAVHAAAGTLIDVVLTSTSGPWEDEDGSGGSIKSFNGLLVIQQTQKVHQEINQLLEMMRAAERTSVKPDRKTGSTFRRKTVPSYSSESPSLPGPGLSGPGYGDSAAGNTNALDSSFGFGKAPEGRRTQPTPRKPPKNQD